jgi:hypothetical protein
MSRKSLAAFLSLFLLALVAAPAVVLAQMEPEKLEVPVVPGTFAVLTTYGDESEGEVFNRSKPLYLDINFVLAMSATGTYPLTLTLMQEAGGKKEEAQIWKGTLEDGFYRLRYPVTLPVGSGEVAVKVVMRVRMFVKKFSEKSSYQYTTWEGTYRVGKR